MDSTDAPIGIDPLHVGAWLVEHVTDLAPPFRVRADHRRALEPHVLCHRRNGRRIVLRRPPLGHLLATAHDVAREYRIVAALAATPVPVPRALAVCEDAQVNGAPFAVTEFVDGVVLDTPEKAASIEVANLRAISFHLIDVLADLHAVDLDAVGLTGLSRHDSYIERQITRWSKQWAGSRTRELPLIDEVESRLRAAVPPQHGASIVHGDYRFGNCITDVGARRIAAVLDWELCTLGDPLADLGHMGIYWHNAADRYR